MVGQHILLNLMGLAAAALYMSWKQAPPREQYILVALNVTRQGMVDGSASQPISFGQKRLTDYMIEKSYHLSQYLGPFGAYFMPQGPK